MKTKLFIGVALASVCTLTACKSVYENCLTSTLMRQI